MRRFRVVDVQVRSQMASNYSIPGHSLFEKLLLKCVADLRRPWARENSDVQLAAACNGTTSVKCVPLVDFCLVNSAPS